MNNIKILGTGCPKCKELEKAVKRVLEANQLSVGVEKVEDIMQIMQYNVMSTPALVVDEVVVMKGKVPSDAEILTLLNSSAPTTESGNTNKCCR